MDSWSLGGKLQTRTFTITPAQILSLAEHPVMLLSSPGAGFATLILALTASLEFAGTQYADGGELQPASACVSYGGPSQLAATVSGTANSNDLKNLLTSPASAVAVQQGVTGTLARAEIEAVPIFLCNPFVPKYDFTAGNSTLQLSAIFATVQL
jgi:hypothetical protein